MKKIMSAEEVIDFIEKTAFLHERIEGDFIPESVTGEISDKHLSKWKKVLAEGDCELFRKRLSFDSLTEDKVKVLLGKVHLRDRNNIPEWSSILEKILNREYPLELEEIRKGKNIHNKFLLSERPVPFEEIYVPLILLAREEVMKRTGNSYNLAGEPVHILFEHSLLASIHYICVKTVYLEFSIFNSDSSFTGILDRFINTEKRNKYDSFIEKILKNNYIDFFMEYRVLARLVCTLISQWIDNNSEFLLRLKEDLSEISEVFNEGKDPGKLIKVDPSVSDRHNGGRQVITLEFESGLKIVYKPKDLSLEKTYFHLLSWFNENKVPYNFKSLKIINRKDYGWVEFADHLPCRDEEEVKIYYRRAGALLCLLYIFSTSDCHMENIIASGEYPVLVDLETLMQGDVRFFEDEKYGQKVRFLAGKKLYDSVLRTGLLPRWQFTPDNKAYDVSGLGSTDDHGMIYNQETWKNLKTDSIRFETDRIRANRMGLNMPYIKDKKISPYQYKDDILQGFNEMYNYMLKNREYLLSHDTLLKDFRGKTVRMIFRATNTYGMILGKSINPSSLRNPLLWSIDIDLLARALSKIEVKTDFLWPLVKYEIKSSEQLDTPCLGGYSDSKSLKLDNNIEIEDFYDISGYDRFISCLERLDCEDLKRQTALIKNSLYAANITGAESFKEREILPVPAESFLEHSLDIAKNIEESAIHFDDSGITWIGNEYIPSLDRAQLQPLGYGLYSGICGVALFLSALEHIEGKGRLKETVLSSLKPLFLDIEDSPDTIVKETGIGGAMGLGSIVYSLTSISKFLEMPPVLEYAKKTALLITDEVIEHDRHFDITGGLAGAILGLLKLYTVTGDKEILHRAEKCGDFLIENRKESKSGYRSWATVENKLLAGFSHGAAGITYSLLRLYSFLNKKTYIDAAAEAIAYENTLFREKFGNWVDLRMSEDKSERFMISWCHGAPGIALGRIGGLCVLDSEDIRKDIERAINTTITCPIVEKDHLCCGNMGRADILLTAGLKLNRPDLKEKALFKAGQIVALTKETGGFKCGIEGFFDAGFFHGNSGIGYELLRLSHPEVIPSVLLFE